MDESELLHRLRRYDERALAEVIDRYTAYVSTIIFNIIGLSACTSDVEETAADVFVALWNSADKVMPGKLKAYLSAVARNKALERLRRAGAELPLEEDCAVVSASCPERELESRELAQFLRRAVMEMGAPDREIFLRHYYYCQRVSQIASELDMSVSTVKTRLRRGRLKLKNILNEGGYNLEDENI